MTPGLQRFTDIAGDGGPLIDIASAEELVRVERAASVALGRRGPDSPGTLFVTTRRVIWLSEADKGKGYAVDFLAITLQAVSRDLEAYPSPCLYMQIEAETGSEEEVGESYPEALDELQLAKVSEMRSEEEVGESYPEALDELQLAKVSEMRIILTDPGQLDALFDVFCHCAELNPGPNAESNEENGWFHGEDMADGGWAQDDEDMLDGNDLEAHFLNVNPIGQNGVHDLNRSVLELQINDQRFEDAEEEQEIQENGH